jgi:uncharacterized protein YyaL (SSP411 family)
MPNRLIKETSPYLLQHAHNPVDWYPWGEEALRRAKEENKPVLLSIGYSACHWCHVMERESFEDAEIARLMNENFINIKVDREERPDLDAIYMQAVQSLAGRGGWPLTAFLTPDGRPFFGGTYFPPEDRHGMPGFPKVLQAVAEAYRNRPAEVLQSAEQLTTYLRQATQPVRTVEPLSEVLLRQAYEGLASEFDTRFGGFGTAPKFPQPLVHEFLLQYFLRTGQSETAAMSIYTLERMVAGGMYDQLGGGFHRYSTDPFWLVPHFEKMLYDNALLARLYLHAHQLTGSPAFRTVVEETIGYVLREMMDPAGGFYSSQDADSEGEEGKSFLWTTGEVSSVLGKEDGELFCQRFGVTVEGNFEGCNILNIDRSIEEIAKEVGLAPGEVEERLNRSRRRLLEARSRRVAPGRDEKVLASWNGLMLRALAEAGAALERSDYLQTAARNADFLLTGLYRDGRLGRSYKDGQVKGKGFLEDYSFFIAGLLALYEATFERRWLDAARALADDMLDLFWDEGAGVFYDTGRDHEALAVRPRDVSDNALPCGSSVAVEVLLRLSLFTGQTTYAQRAITLLRSMQGFVARFPSGMGHWLCVLDFYLSTPKEVALVGAGDDPATLSLKRVVHGLFQPKRIVAGYDPRDGDAAHSIPLLEGKGLVDGKPAAYVCQNYACQAPVTTPEELEQALGSSSGGSP